MILPLWAVFGLGAALLSAAMMLTQERLKVNAYAAAFWGKGACVLLMAPFMWMYGFPADPLFYFYLAITAVLFAISDVIFYRGITSTNAGAVARLLPSSVIFSFLLWFLFDPALLEKYLHAPVISGMIFGVLCLSAYFAMRLKKCAFSMQALRTVWFVVLAATAGPLLAKAVTLHAPPGQGPYAYVFCQGAMMMALWLIYFAVRKPVPVSAILGKLAWRHGLIIGAINAGSTFLSVLAYYYVDNPAYIPAVRFLDSVFILAVYRLWRHETKGDIPSGLGIVGCAAGLVILKAQI